MGPAKTKDKVTVRDVGDKRNYTRVPNLEALGKKMLNQWTRGTGKQRRKWDIRVFRAHRKKYGAYAVVPKGGLLWPALDIHNKVDGAIVLPHDFDIAKSLDLLLFKHELIHIMLPGHEHDKLFWTCLWAVSKNDKGVNRVFTKTLRKRHGLGIREGVK